MKYKEEEYQRLIGELYVQIRQMQDFINYLQKQNKDADIKEPNELPATRISDK